MLGWGLNPSLHSDLSCYSCILFFLFFSLFWLPHSIWTSQAKEQIRATGTTYAAAAATPDLLIHCARLGMEPVSWSCGVATDPIAPQWELLFIMEES